jgi:hypothetical protein
MPDSTQCDVATGEVTGTINQPDLTSGLKPRCRAIKDVKQARAIVRAFEQNSRERNIKNARISSKYNAEKPFRQESLDAEGLG